jgi:thioredoxin-related protein
MRHFTLIFALTLYLFSGVHYPSDIQYMSLKDARKEAINENKLVMIEIEDDNCTPCRELNMLLHTNNNIKDMINNHIKVVKLNRKDANIPPKLKFIGTPTVFLIKPKDGRILVKLQGKVAITDLELSLEMFIYNN